jgi:hypothetical protein
MKFNILTKSCEHKKIIEYLRYRAGAEMLLPATEQWEHKTTEKGDNPVWDNWIDVEQVSCDIIQ